MRIINKNNHQFAVESIEENSRYDGFWDSVQLNEWENETFQIFDRFVNAGSVVFDIGAWIGPTALYLARIADQVYAFEPDPVAFHQLRKNKELNPSFTNLEIQNIALGEKDGILEMGMNTGYGDSMTSVLWSKNIIDAKCENIDEWLWDKIPTFIKMDIEGGEFHVLKHMMKYVMVHHPTILLSMHSRWFESPTEYLDALMPVLSQYEYLYDDKMNRIDYSNLQIKSMGGFHSIIATNKEQ